MLRDDLLNALKTDDVEIAKDLLDLFLSEQAPLLPPLMLNRLNYLRNSVFPLFDGNADWVIASTEFVPIQNAKVSTEVLWAKRTMGAIDLLSQYFPKAKKADASLILGSLQALKEAQEGLPPLSTSDAGLVEPPVLVSESTVSTEDQQSLITEFQDRGEYSHAMRDFFSNKEKRILIIAGPMGIGKTSFLEWVFPKAFNDWQVI